MDPISTIVAALAAGAVAATTDVAAQAVKDGYAAFKDLLVSKLGGQSDVAAALEGVERKPESEARQAVLKEELEAAGAGQDAEVVQSAGALLDLLKEHGLAAGPSYRATLSGSGAIAQGEGAVAAGERGVAIGGGVTGSSIVTGDRDEGRGTEDEGPKTKDEGDG
jgi:hypothetical protein